MALADAMKRERTEPPDESITEDGLIETVGWWFTVGDIVMERATLPAKPFRLKRDMVELSDSPLPRTISVLLLPMVKVGDGACVKVALWTVACGNKRPPFEKRTQVVVPLTLDGLHPVWYEMVEVAVPVTLKTAVNNSPVAGESVRKPGGPICTRCRVSTLSVDRQVEPVLRTTPTQRSMVLPVESKDPPRLTPAGFNTV